MKLPSCTTTGTGSHTSAVTTSQLTKDNSNSEENHSGTSSSTDVDIEENNSEESTSRPPMLPPSEMSEMHPDVCSGDLGRVIKLKLERNLRDDEKFYLLKHHFCSSKGI